MTLYLLLIVLFVMIVAYLVYRTYIHHTLQHKENPKKKEHHYTFKL
jgi:Tfp pilus assembly protein PilO